MKWSINGGILLREALFLSTELIHNPLLLVQVQIYGPPSRVNGTYCPVLFLRHFLLTSIAYTVSVCIYIYISSTNKD